MKNTAFTPLGNSTVSTSKIFLTCPECGQKFEAKHHRASFCSPAHRNAYNNRQLAEGQRIVAIAKAWRQSRSTSDKSLKEAGKAAFSQLCRELDMLNAADFEHGRMSALKVYRRRLAGGLLDHQGPLASAAKSR
ncbi:hypothetical protein [Caulobacter phage BL94]|nr:hypothetical protein [Caulobacter phage BL94]